MMRTVVMLALVCSTSLALAQEPPVLLPAPPSIVATAQGPVLLSPQDTVRYRRQQQGKTLLIAGIGAVAAGVVEVALAQPMGYHATTLPGGPGVPPMTVVHDETAQWYGLGGAIMGVGAGLTTAGAVLYARNRIQVLPNGFRF